MGLERCGHDFEPAKTAVSKLGLGLKRENRPFKANFTAEPHLAYDCSALALVFKNLTKYLSETDEIISALALIISSVLFGVMSYSTIFVFLDNQITNSGILFLYHLDKNIHKH